MRVGVFVQAVFAVSPTDAGLARPGMETLHRLEVLAVDIGFTEVQTITGAHGRTQAAGIDR